MWIITVYSEFWIESQNFKRILNVNKVISKFTIYNSFSFILKGPFIHSKYINTRLPLFKGRKLFRVTPLKGGLKVV